MTIIASIWFIFLFITGAIGIMTAGGDKNSLETSKKRLTNGFIGLVIIIAAIFIIRTVGFVLGVDYLLNPGGFIRSVWQ